MRTKKGQNSPLEGDTRSQEGLGRLKIDLPLPNRFKNACSPPSARGDDVAPEGAQSLLETAEPELAQGEFD